MKSFGIPCDFGGQKQTILFYIGEPNPEQHPIHFQATWLSSNKGGVVPADMTRNVWQLGEVAPNLVKQLVDINGKFNSPLGFGTDESFNVDHLDVHMVAQPGFDMDDFVRQLRAARDLSKHS